MNGNNIVEIVKSPACTAIVITRCTLLVMNQIPVMFANIKALNSADVTDAKQA